MSGKRALKAPLAPASTNYPPQAETNPAAQAGLKLSSASYPITAGAEAADTQAVPLSQFYTLTVIYKLTRHTLLAQPLATGQAYTIPEATIKEVAGEGVTPAAALDSAMERGLGAFVAGTFAK